MNPLQPQSGFDQMLAPQDTSSQVSVPQTPEDVQGRRGAWSQLLEEPNFKSALFRMGLQMMQGTRQGESSLGATARAGMDSMDYLAAKNELDRKAGLETRAADTTNKNVDSQIASRDVETQQNTGKLSEWQDQAAQRKEQATLALEQARRSGKKGDMELITAQFDSDEKKREAEFLVSHPELAGEMRRAKLLKPEADLNQTYAQTGNLEATMRSSDASMERTNTLAAGEQQANQREQDLWNSMSPEERKTSKLFTAGKTGTNAGGSEYTAQAQSILEQYNALAPEKRPPSIDQFVTENFNVPLGKSASGVIGEIKRLQAAGNPGSGITERWGLDPKTKKPVRIQ